MRDRAGDGSARVVVASQACECVRLFMKIKLSSLGDAWADAPSTQYTMQIKAVTKKLRFPLVYGSWLLTLEAAAAAAAAAAATAAAAAAADVYMCMWELNRSIV